MRIDTVRSLFVAAPFWLALAGTALAQAPHDTLDWQRYYPLAIGNAWEYHEAEVPGDLIRHVLVSDTTAGPHRYFRRTTHHELQTLTDTLRWASHDFVRYDTAGVVVAIASIEADTVAVDPCHVGDYFVRDLRLAFGARAACPGAEADSVVVEGAYDTSWTLDGVAVAVAAVKRYVVDGLIFSEFVADIGPVGGGNLWGPRLHYARVGGVEYGSPVLVAVAAEPTPPKVAGLEVRILQNPVRARASFEVRASRSERGRIEVFDLSGRRVRTVPVELAPGWRRVEIPTASLAAGTYVARVSTVEGAASRRFTVLR